LLVKDLTGVDIRSYVRSDEEAATKQALIESYRRAALEQGCTLAQLALQYVRSLDGVDVTLLGVSSQQQLTSLLTGGLPPVSRREPAIPHSA
jgi:aryl-alcohol dehydrogenase-like predicted oxidoreductase